MSRTTALALATLAWTLPPGWHAVETRPTAVVEPAQPVPPSPPAGWRHVVSGAYDSMRVPPGWSARALKRPKRTPRPRLLFRIAKPDGSVVVRVAEHRRGPPSPAFPPAREPLVIDANRRAGMSFRGYRFSIRTVARPHATPHDLEWADVSARSLGVSGVGRG